MSTPTLDTRTVRRWKRYPEYSPTDHWFMELPAHWRPIPVKHTFRILNGATPQSSEASYWDGEIPWATPEDLGNLVGDTLHQTRRQITAAGYENCGTTLAPAGSLVLSTRAPIGHVAISGTAMCTNQGCRTLVFKTTADVRFFYYLIVACRPELQSLGRGSTFLELSRDELAAAVLPVPTLPEQRAIAAFLDRETARIDALIERKERLIALLEEKRQAVISYAVTRSLDPAALLEDSGLPGLGGIPSHWTITRLKFATSNVTVGVVVTPSKYYVDDGVPALRGLNVREGRIEEADLVFFGPESNQLLAKSMLHTGDLVVVRTGQPGTAAVVPEWLHNANCIDLILIRRSPRFNSHFLCYLANSRVAKAQYGEGAEGAIQQHFNIETAKNMTIFLPPMQEQTKIVRYLDERTADLTKLMSRVRDGIDRLQEYRTALISAAVTGQIDVRGEVGEPAA